MRSFQRFLWLAVFSLPAQANVPRESCLRADSSDGSTPTVAAATEPLKGPLASTLGQLLEVMDVSASVRIVDSPAGGVASAHPSCRKGSAPTYVITADVELLQEREDQLRGASLVLIAHELGHVLQFVHSASLVEAVCTNNLKEVKTLELMADFAAGYAVYKTQKTSIDRGNTLLARTIASVADYGFADVTHHGTVTERMNAFDFGEAAALRGRHLDMAALMRNSANFVNRLGGPSLAAMTAGNSYEEWVKESLAEIYQ